MLTLKAAQISEIGNESFFKQAYRINLVSYHKRRLNVFCCAFNNSYYQDTLFEKYLGYDPCFSDKTVVKRRAEFFAGRYMAKKALQNNGNEKYFVAVGENREPVWPNLVSGSITHTMNFAAAVVCKEPDVMGVGIDAEYLIDSNVIKLIQSDIINCAEKKLIDNSGNNQEFLFSVVFSAKESFFKAAYPQVKTIFDFDAVTVVKIDRVLQLLVLRVQRDLAPSLPTGKLIFSNYSLIEPNLIVTYQVLLR